MAVGKVDMWNLVLAELGGADQNEIIDDDSNTELKAVRWLGYVWEQCNDYVAVIGTWRQLTEYEELAAADDSVERAEWDYAYPLPTDIARFVDLTDVDDHTQSYPHEIAGTFLLTNETEKYIKYIRKIVESDYGRMDPVLKQAIITWTAQTIAIPMVGGETGQALKASLLNRFYRLDVPWAEGANEHGVYEAPVRLWTETGGVTTQDVDRVTILDS